MKRVEKEGVSKREGREIPRERDREKERPGARERKESEIERGETTER